MDPNQQNPEKMEEELKETQEISLNFPNIPKINVEYKFSEEDDVERSYSPSKYFGKRPSFEYKNLRKIERTTIRALSAVQKKRVEVENTPSSKTYDEESLSPQDMENSKVHFSAHVLEDEKEVSSPSKVVIKKPKKSILKKSNFNEEIILEKIFNKDINEDFMDKLALECAKEGKHFSEKICKSFMEYWKNLSNENGIRFLQVFL